jgi:hypothetical protein
MQLFMSFSYPKLGLIDKLLLSCWATGADVADQYKIQQQKN